VGKRKGTKKGGRCWAFPAGVEGGGGFGLKGDKKGLNGCYLEDEGKRSTCQPKMMSRKEILPIWTDAPDEKREYGGS